jgi:multiple sugar transport system permease protein
LSKVPRAAQENGGTATIRSARYRWRRRTLRGVLYSYLVVGALAILVPYFWMLSASLKPRGEIFRAGINFLPQQPILDNYLTVLDGFPIIRWLVNSFLIGLLILATNLTLTVAAGYAFARLRFWGRDVLFLVYIGAMMVPIQVRMIPSFIIVMKIGWLNTYQGIASLQLIEFFGIFLIRQFMLNLPRELEDAARIDGCSWFRVLWQIILPNSRPALAALAIFTFTASWNDFLWPLVIINKPEIMTIQVGLATMKGSAFSVSGLLMAATMISALPLAIVYLLLQRQFTQGVVMSGIKG